MRNPDLQINIFQAPPKEVISSEEEGCGCSAKPPISSEEGCGCDKKYSSSSEEGSSCSEKDSSSSEETLCHVEVQTSEESHCSLPSEEKDSCSKEAQTSKTWDETSEEYSEETHEKCPDYSSEEHYSSELICSCKKPKKIVHPPTCSSEEFPKISCPCCRNYESSEEIQTQSSEEHLKCPEVKKPKSIPKKKKCDSSEEILVESSEEHKVCEDSAEIFDEEHWCKGKPTKIYSKRFRYSNSEGCGKRFSRYRRELFLDDMQDFSVYTEPLTRNEIRKTIAKIRANSTIASGNKRRRKNRRRQKNQELVQNKDQFEENNKLKHIFEAKTIDAVEDKTKDVQDDDDLIVNGKQSEILESSPKQLEQKIEDELLQIQNEERNKRHSQCRTIEHLKKNPKYRMNILADAGCSQYIPEIISNSEENSSELDSKNEYYDYLTNRNKRHLSTFDGNINFPIKFVDATKRTNSHPYHLKKIQYRRHHHPKHHPKPVHKPEIPQNHDNFAVDPKFYYKYLSLTAPDLSTNQKTKTNLYEDLQGSSPPKEKKIVYDHLGHKFLEYNGFRTLIKPKIEYSDDTSYEKPKFWTCKEDLIDPKDFGKVTTISEDLETVTEPVINLGTTMEINFQTEEPKTNATTTEENSTPGNLPEIEDLQEHELNLCEYLKNLELTQNIEVQQEAKNTFLHNCESYIKFLIFNPSNEDRSSNITDLKSKYLENLLHNSQIKHHIKKLFHTKHKFENNLANITKLLHKPKVVENFKNYLLFQNEFDSMKSKLNLNEYTINNFYIDMKYVLNNKFDEIISTTTEKLSTNN